MRRKLGAIIVTGLLAGAVVASSLAPAEATHTLGHLRRQINRLENQVSALRDECVQLRAACRLPSHRSINGPASDGYVRRLHLLIGLRPSGGPALPSK